MTAPKEKQEEDEVDYEIPVYLSKSLNGQLHILQHPVRPSTAPYDDDSIHKVQFKPESKQLEMEIGLATRVPTFDRSKGEQIALNVDGASRNNRNCDENFFKSSVMDKIILNSTDVIADPSRYAVGVIEGNSLHITPITAILAMRPSLEYLDTADKRYKHDNKDNSGDDSDGEPKERKLTVRFAGEESERSKKYREKSYNFLQKKIREEPWIPLEYHKLNSKSGEFERSKLFCAHTHDVVDQFHLDDSTFLHQLVPVTDKKDFTNVPTHMLSNAELRILPLLDRLRAIMFNAGVASFREILSTVNVTKKKSEETQTVLKTIQQVAVLVQGNWVAKSDVVFPKENRDSSDDGNLRNKHIQDHNDVLQRIRDYVLFLFTQSNYVRRAEVCRAFNAQSADVLTVLKSVAKSAEEGVWEFALPPDNAFIKKYGDVAQRQEMIWKSRYEQLKQYLSTQIDMADPGEGTSSNFECGGENFNNDDEISVL